MKFEVLNTSHTQPSSKASSSKLPLSNLFQKFKLFNQPPVAMNELVSECTAFQNEECVPNPPNVSSVVGQNEEMLSDPEDPRFKEANSIDDLSTIERNFSKLTNPEFIRSFCNARVPGWDIFPIEKIRVEQIMSGLTNQLFHVYVLRDSPVRTPIRYKRVLFRIYGENIGQLYDSSFEIEVFKTLGRYRIAPKLIAQFDGGRIEEWIYGKPLVVKDLLNPTVTSAIANIIGGFHRLHKDISDFPFQKQEGVSCLFLNMINWLNSGLIHSKYEELNIHSILSLNELNLLKEEAYNLQKLILSNCHTHTPAKDIVFCHNDSQENNFLKAGSNLTLIDFEYTNFNFAGFDIANFFTEAVIDYTHTEYPFFLVETDNYPCIESRGVFACVYLTKVMDQVVLPSQSIVKPFLEQVEWFTLASNLYWGFWGLIRSPVNYDKSSFDFVLYAKQRFSMYWKRKEELMYNSKNIYGKEH